jgi:hypothetical protein
MIKVWIFTVDIGIEGEPREILLPGAPRIGDTLRLYGPNGPCLRTVRNVTWDESSNRVEAWL